MQKHLGISLHIVRMLVLIVINKYNFWSSKGNLFNLFLGLLPKENNHSILEVMFLVSSKYPGFYKVKEVHARQNKNEFNIVLLLSHGWQCSGY